MEPAATNAIEDGMSVASNARINSATRAITSVLGVVLALAGIHHGLLEITLHGNRPTGGMHIQAIGKGQLMWAEGTEDALTLLPNFLLTGVAAIVVALALAWWSVFRVHARRGPSLFLALCILLTFVGGGTGHIAFFVPIWGYATRIRKPLRGWRTILPSSSLGWLARAWRGLLLLAVVSFVVALELSVFGMVLDLGEEQQVLYVTWACLLASLSCVNLAYACGAASDILAAA
jgi:hypothetical protein